MATMQQIHEKLTGKFGEAIADWREPEAGDARIDVAAESLHEICRFLRDDPAMKFDYLRLVTAVDWKDHFSSVYHLYSYTHGHEVVVSVELSREKPAVATVTDLWPAADWLERECYDMMGIVYEGHPDPGRILLPEDWEGFPLRKDYEPPLEYHGISNQ